MARAIRRSRKRSVSPVEATANAAEALANERLGLAIDGYEFITEVDDELAIDVAKMYQLLLTK